MTSTDSGYLNGFSGMGLFIEEEADQKKDICLTAIFSRDMGSASRLYLTDVIRLYELVREMQEDFPIIFPKAEYVPLEKMAEEKTQHETDSLNIILEKIFRNPNDYFRCLCGYTGVGKTFTVNLVKNYCPQCFFESSWIKLIECLNSGKLRELSDTTYVIDPLEQLLTEEERERLSSQCRPNLERLNTEEKKNLFLKIQEQSENLITYNIHILLICHSFFWKDVEVELEAENKHKKALIRGLRNSIVSCEGYDVEAVKRVLELKQICVPDYFFEIPLIKRPRWLMHLVARPEKMPREEEIRYDYEFRLYGDTLGWLQDMENGQGIRRELRRTELDQIEGQLYEYLKTVLEFQDVKRLKWSKENLFLICTYPFAERNGDFQMKDLTLRTYLIAKALYELAKNEEEDFLKYLMIVYEMGADDLEFEGRLKSFFHRFLLQEEDGEAGTENYVFMQLRSPQCKKYFEWWYKDTRVLLQLPDKKQKKRYLYNSKTDEFIIETEQQQTQKFALGDLNTEELEKIEVKRLTRNNPYHE